MAIRLYNTATRKKEVFHPVRDAEVGIYVCGVTVYDLCHIGHARSAVFFDVLVRYLRARGFQVTYVRNFTDVDDKIIDRARRLGKEPGELAEEYIRAFYQDMGRLGVLNADKEPRATEYIEDMIRMIEVLLEKGYAYESGGDVYYSVEAFQGYGELSGRRIEDMIAGSRVAVDERKRHPMDFALWKAAKEGEPRWPSPWGPGRPGWHMECSVMSNRFLGDTFDIHGGGEDLLFPHHENERAQSIAANGGEFARYWVHNGFVTLGSEKMSKSLGNFLTIRDALKSYHPEVLRVFLLSKHYRSPLDFSEEAVSGLQSGLVRIYRLLQRLEELMGGPDPEEIAAAAGLRDEPVDLFLKQFVQIMDDDINTAAALGLIFEKVKEMNRSMDDAGGSPPPELLSRLRKEQFGLLAAAGILGFLQETPGSFFKAISETADQVDTAQVETLLLERDRARSERDWQKADAIRDRLRQMGVVLEDTPQGTKWRFEV